MKNILCISFPEEIRAAIKFKNSHVYENCCFSDSYNDFSKYTVIILPVEIFIYKADLFRQIKVLTFGNPEYLEEAFLLGSCDYLKTPWTCEEFIQRLNRAVNIQNLISAADLISLTPSRLLIDRKAIPLTQKERSIFFLLYTNRNTLVSYKTISEYIGIKSENYENTLFVYISRLKNKMKETIPDTFPHSINISVIYKKGYMLEIDCV